MITSLVVLAIVSVAWADLHFLLAVFRAGQWWDVIPLIGMGIVTYCICWLFWRVWEAREVLPQITNLFTNIGILLRTVVRRPGGNEFVRRMTLPPTEFERQLLVFVSERGREGYR